MEGFRFGKQRAKASLVYEVLLNIYKSIFEIYYFVGLLGLGAFNDFLELLAGSLLEKFY